MATPQKKKNGSVFVGAYIPVRVKDALGKLSADKERSIAYLIRWAIRDFVTRENGAKP